MSANNAHLIHTDYDEILKQVSELSEVDEDFKKTA
jgi:hypothetical protein